MKTLNEFLLGKDNPKFFKDLKHGCTCEEIAEWLEQMGVTNHVKYNGSMHYPEVGELMYEICPDEWSMPDEYWIELIGVPIKNEIYQSVAFKPKAQYSIFTNVNTEEQEFIEFDKAVEIAKEMIADPNKVIKL